MALALPVQHSGSLFQPFQLTDADITALIYAARYNDFHQRLHNLIAALVHPQRQQLHYQNLAKPVDNQAGQKIRFTIYQAVCIRSRQKPLSMAQAACKPLSKKSGIHSRQRFPVENSHPDL
ncbi:hypothetical protein D3C75_932010 [compost metagenome]